MSEGAAEGDATPRKKTVLVVDDTPDNLALMTSILRDAYRVKVATSGARALAISSSADPPDLVLLDVMMPEMDGYEVCRRLKASPATAEIPVVFLTARSDVADETKGFGCGAEDYVAKPVSPPILLARVATHLTLRSAREYLKEKNRFLEFAFSRYVSRRVFEQLEATPVDELLRMERRDLSILFADIRGFTALGDRLAPEEIEEIVDSFLETMVACVEEHDGTVDKFLGDGLMAIFGAPLRQEDHARRALRAACAMQAAHRGWMARRCALGKPANPLGIGVATGEAVVGSIGTPSRMEFTALGHVVNLAARLCAAAGAGEVLTTRTTEERAAPRDGSGGDVPYRVAGRGSRAFKNVAAPVEVVTLVAREGDEGEAPREEAGVRRG